MSDESSKSPGIPSEDELLRDALLSNDDPIAERSERPQRGVALSVLWWVEDQEPRGAD